MLQLDGFPTGDSVQVRAHTHRCGKCSPETPRLTFLCVCAQADRSAGRLTGSMMELQTLQEALKVEIQIHQVRCGLSCFLSWPLALLFQSSASA